MRRAVLMLALLPGCSRPAFDDPADEAMQNAPLPTGLVIKYVGEDVGPARFMDPGIVVDDPGRGGPTRLVEFKLSSGERKGEAAKGRRMDVIPADPEAWKARLGIR